MNDRKILVAEDERPLAISLQRKLQEMGHDVTLIANGDDALGEIRRGSYDLVILDIMMPGTNGFDVLESLQVKENPTTVVVTSNLSDKKAILRAKDLGAKEYLPKSEHTLEDMREAVLRYL